MKYFIGIVPPDDISQRISDIQNQFGDNRLEPHITLLPPEEKTKEQPWLQQTKDVAESTTPFPVTLTGTGNFGKGVLFINVQSKGLIGLWSSLKRNAVWPDSNKSYENRAFIPHLTLGRAWCGFTSTDFMQMKMLTEEWLSKGEQIFTVSFIRVYYKPYPQKGFSRMCDVNFGT